MNLAAQRLFAYTSEQVIGQSVKLLMPDRYYQERDVYLATYRLPAGRRLRQSGRKSAP